MISTSAELSLENGRTLRIGDVAARTGLTARTIRYYEEIGLLPGGTDRAKGRHRRYDPDDIERLRLVALLRELLGLSLDELHELVAAGGAWLVPHRPWGTDESIVERSGAIDHALAQIDRQLDLVRAREVVLAELAQALLERRQAIASKRLTGD